MNNHNKLHTNRRQVLRTVSVGTAAGLTGLAGCIGSLDDEDDSDAGDDGDDREESEEIEDIGTVTFGVLEPLTGDFASLAEEQVRGVELGVEHVNGSDEYDFEIEHEVYDTQLNAEDAVQAASSAIDREGADYLTGCISSSVALAINEVALDNEVIFAPAAADVSITGSNCNEYVFRPASNTAQLAEAMTRWTADELGDNIVYHIADYAYGHSVKQEFESRMEQLSDSYQEVQLTSTDLGEQNYDSALTQIADVTDEADALVVGMTGGGLVNFLRQARERDLHDEIPIVTETASFAPVLAGAGESAYGVYTGVRYVPDTDEGDNQAFVSAYEDAYDETPDNFARDGYESVRMLANGIQEAGTGDPTVVREVLPGIEQETTLGRNEFRECDQQAMNRVWMGRAVEPEQGDMADIDILDVLSGDEAAPDCDSVGCEL